MKKYSFRFVVVFLTFAVGVAFANSWFSEILLTKFFAIDEINAEFVQTQGSEKTEELSFYSKGGLIACGRESVDSNLYSVSDGSEISSTSVYNFKTGKQNRKNFESYLKKAITVYELSSILDEEKNEIGKKAIIEVKDKVLIVSFSELKSEYGKSFVMTTVTTPSLRHALAFEKEQESFAKSVIMASQIKP
jgi:outer membrane lipoprotein-sorting protein